MKATKAALRKNSPQYEDYYHLLRVLCTIMGLPLFTLYDHSKGLKKILYINYQKAIEVTLIATTVGQFWAMPGLIDNIDALCSCLSAAIHTLQVLLKTQAFSQNKRKFLNHFAEINEQLRKQYELSNEISEVTPLENYGQFFYRETRFVKKLLILFFGLLLFAVTCLFLPHIIKSIVFWREVRGQRMPTPFYFCYDYGYTPAYQIVSIFLNIGFYILNLQTVLSDSFMLSLIVFHTVQFKYLKELLKVILQCYEKDATNLHLLKKWTILHQRQLQLAYNLKKMASLYATIEIAYILYTFCPIFCITSAVTWPADIKGGVIFIVGVGLFQLLLTSQAGEQFTHSINDTCLPLYNTTITLPDEIWMRMSFLLSSKMSQKPLILKAAGVIPLNISTFQKLCRLMISYYLSLVELQDRKQVMDTNN